MTLPSVPPVYRAVLTRTGVRPLVTGAFLVGMSIGGAALSLILLVQEATASFASAGLAAACFGWASGVMAPVRGWSVDRFGQPRTLVGFAAAFAGLLLLMVVLSHVGVASGFYFGVAAMAGAVTPPVGAALRSCWKDVAASDQELAAAYALDNVLQEVYLVLAPLLVGALVLIGSPALSLGAAGVLVLFGAVWFSSSGFSRHRRVSRGTLRVGWAGPLKRGGMRVLASSVLALGISFGTLEIAVTSFAIDHDSAAAAGWLLAMLAIGSVIGGSWYGAREWSRGAAGRYAGMALCFGVILVGLSQITNVVALAVGLVVAGLFVAPAWTCLYQLLDDVVPSGTDAEAYGWLSLSNNVGIATGAALGGFFVGLGGSGWALVLAGTAAGLAALIAIAWHGRLTAVADDPSADFRDRHPTAAHDA